MGKRMIQSGMMKSEMMKSGMMKSGRIKSRIGKSVFSILLFLILFAGFCPGLMAKEKASISQVDVYLPDLHVYIDQADRDQDFTARFPETATSLTPESIEAWKDTDRGIFYHILLDVSDSVSEKQLANMKKSIIQLSDTLGKKDRMEIITFSDGVKVVFEKKQKPSEVKKALDKVKKGQKTHLYQGINALSDSVAKEKASVIEEDKDQEDILRNVGIILTDWQEAKKAGGQTSREETLKALQKTGCPLYGYCLNTAAVSLQDDMGQFLRSTGGKFTLYKANKKQLVDLADSLQKQSLLRISSSSNKCFEEEKTLEVNMGEDLLKKEHVYLNLAKKDKDSPTITSVEEKQGEADVLYINFSEDVLNADNKNNYSIQRDGKNNYTVSEASYSSENKVYQARLVLNDKLMQGDYEISIINVTDNSNEENALSGSWSGHLEGEGPLKAFYAWLGRYWIILLVIAVIIILLIIYLYIKKHKGIMVVEDKMVLGSNMGKKQHVKSEPTSTMDIVMEISGINTKVKRTQTRIDGSIMVGRASICDVYFDDMSMSRQHFALEVDQGELYITDLESTAGTYVDGVKISQRTRLKNGSRIKAGSVTIVISW